MGVGQFVDSREGLGKKEGGEGVFLRVVDTPMHTMYYKNKLFIWE